MKLVIMPDGYHVRVDLKTPRGSVTLAHGLGTTRAANEFIESFKTDVIEWAKELSNERNG